MLGMSVIFTPFAAQCFHKLPIKIVLCLSLICVLIGSISFIACTNVWVWVIIQSTLTAYGTSTIQICALLLAWEWFSPERRGVVNGLVVGLRYLAITGVIMI